MFGWITRGHGTPHRLAEPSGSYDTAACFAGQGLVGGTCIATATGWRGVETIQAGDMVLTFDNGMQAVAAVRRTTFRTNPAQARPQTLPLVVPVGALSNRVPLVLLPEQGVMVESDAASDSMGDPFAVVPAHTLTGYRGIRADYEPRELTLVTVCFERPQVVYAEAGTLIYCPQAHVDLLNMVKQEYKLLPLHEARFLVECMQYEDETTGVGVSDAA